MLYPIGKVEYLQKLNELVSLENQVKAVRLQDKLGKQNFHEDMKKLIEAVTKSLEKTSQDITKSITETSIEINREISDLNEKVLELMNDKILIAPYLASSLVNLFKPENKSQLHFKKDLNSTKMNDVLINETIPVTLYSNMLTFKDTNRTFKLDGDLLKAITNCKFNADHSNPQDKKLIFGFAKEMNFDVKKIRRPSTIDGSVIRILKSPAIMASGLSTIFLSSDPNELCDRLKSLLQKKTCWKYF